MTAKSSIRPGGAVYIRRLRAKRSGPYPGEICRLSRRRGLRPGEPDLTGRQKSAEGILGPRQARLVGHPNAERRGSRKAAPHHLEPKARTVPRKGSEGEESSPRVEPRECHLVRLPTRQNWPLGCCSLLTLTHIVHRRVGPQEEQYNWGGRGHSWTCEYSSVLLLKI